MGRVEIECCKVERKYSRIINRVIIIVRRLLWPGGSFGKEGGGGVVVRNIPKLCSSNSCAPFHLLVVLVLSFSSCKRFMRHNKAFGKCENISSTYLFIYLFIYSFHNLFIHSFISFSNSYFVINCLLTHLFIYSFIQPIIYIFRSIYVVSVDFKGSVPHLLRTKSKLHRSHGCGLDNPVVNW